MTPLLLDPHEVFMSFGIRDLTTAAVTPPFGAPTITPTPPSPTNSVVKGDGVDASRPPLRFLGDAAALSQLTADAGDATAVKTSGRSESDDGALPNGLHVRHQSPMMPSSAPTAASSTSPAPANESWANRAWNFVVGDDIDNTFGKDKSVGQRLLGGLNLGLDASLVIPDVDIETGALKAAIKGGETAAKVVDGAVGSEKALSIGEREAGRSSAIAAGEHSIPSVGDAKLSHSSQDLSKIESIEPKHGEPHTLEMHSGKSDAFLEHRTTEPTLRSDGTQLLSKKGDLIYNKVATTFKDVSTAQASVDATIAKPSNQAKIKDWLANGASEYLSLTTDLGHEIGHGVRRTDVLAGLSKRIPSNIANVVLKADPLFPEGYKILTAYPKVTP